MSHLPWTILLVEDDEDDYILVRDLLKTVLEPGFTLHWALDYSQGLELLGLHPDVLLVDYHLGSHTGLDVVAEAGKRGCTAPMILLTGKGNYKVDLAAMRAGVADYLPKEGLTGPVLERTIRYAIEASQAAERLRQEHDQLEVRVHERTRELWEANDRLETANQNLIVEINQRKRAQAAEESERQRLFRLMENLPALVYLIAPDYSIRFGNARFREQIGAPNGDCCYQLLYHQPGPCHDCPVFSQDAQPTPREWETTLPDGKSLHLYSYPFTDSDGSPLTIEMGIDITRRKQAEAELELYNQELIALTESERTQRRLAEGLVEATTALNYSLDLDTVLDRILEQTQSVIPCCAAGILLLEADHLHVARQRGFEAYPGARPILEGHFLVTDLPFFQQMSATGEPVLVSDTRPLADAFRLRGLEWVHSYAAAPLQVAGQLYGFLNILSDIPDQFGTEILGRLNAFAANAAVAIHNAHLYKDLENALSHEQAMRTQLVESEKFAAMGRMVASVAHELNNPLQTIKNCLFLIQGEIPAQASIHEYLDMAYSETQRLSKLVTQLRELYRPRISLAPNRVAAHELVQQVYALLEPQLQSKSVRWRDRMRPEPAWILGHADHLKQVFINICQNALEAMQPHGGELSVTCQHSMDSRQVGVTFTDCGPGIPEENLPRLFEPFFTTKSDGLGLGLAICFEIVDRHGGHITVESQPGQGAAFTVWLPACPAGE